MQDKANEWHSSPDNDNTEGIQEQQVPSTLLPNVLQRLGLTPEQTTADFELSADALIAKLKSKRWEDRVVAVRALGKLEASVPIDMFAPVLHDEDATVRAATVHVLGNMGKRVPLHWLVEALQDSDWHVREVAVLALGKQGRRVPDEVLMTALHDNDSSVRETARFALQWNSLAEKTLYGRLWEEKLMQREQHDTVLSNGKHNSIPLENAAYNDWNGTIIEYSSNSQATHSLKEQAQAYASRGYEPNAHTSQETPAYEYAETTPSRGEKITSYRIRSKSPKGWWAAIIVTAFLFLALGRLTVSGLPQINIDPGTSKVISSVNEQPTFDPFNNPNYAPVMQKELASVFNLTPQQIMEQLKMRGSLSSIATSRGVALSTLQNSELKVTSQAINAALDAGNISKEQAAKLTLQLQNDPDMLEKASISLFEAAPI